MTPDAKITCGIILLTVPSIIYGGYFLLSILSKPGKLALTDFQKAMFRAGHAHAGVLVIFALLAEILIDNANLGAVWIIMARVGFPLAAILVSGGFFAAAAGKNITRPNKSIAILYAGMIVLIGSLIILGIGLLIH